VNPTVAAFDPATERAGAPRPLTSRTGLLNPHSISPDGQWLLLTNSGEIKEDLFLMRTDGTGLRRLTDDAARDRAPRWTPDGKALVYYSNRDGVYGIYSLRPDGSGLARLAAPGKSDLFYPSVSPADGTLAFSNDNFESFLLSPPFQNGAEPRVASGLDVEGNALMLALWSPDGRWISGPLLSRSSGVPVGIGVYDVASQKAMKLSDDGGPWTAPFLPDSRRVIYVTAQNELVVVDIATRQRRIIPFSFGGDVNSESFALAPDGKSFFYGAHRTEANVWMATGSGVGGR
jgi:Tol biopolymer transport system component